MKEYSAAMAPDSVGVHRPEYTPPSTITGRMSTGRPFHSALPRALMENFSTGALGLGLQVMIRKMLTISTMRMPGRMPAMNSLVIEVSVATP